MRVEEDGHLCLHFIDLLEQYRGEDIRDVPKVLEEWHFTREANIAACYATQAGYKITFAIPGRLETLELYWSPGLQKIEKGDT